MFIRNCLTDRRNLTVIETHERVSEVLDKMEGHLSLPCATPGGKFIGMVSKRTIFEAFQAAVEQGVTYEAFLNTSVEHCVDSTVRTLGLHDHFEDTIDIIIRQPFVPIVENGQFLGIVKRGDVNHALSIAFATNVESDRLLIGLPEVEGALERVFDVTHRLNINVITAVTFDAGEHALNRRLILKVSKSNKLETLVQQLEKAGFLMIQVNN